MGKFNQVNRRAKVGEKILIVDADCTFGDYNNGAIFTVKNKGTNIWLEVEEYSLNGIQTIYHTEYVVLEPVEK
jgi:hypothetical protein